MVLKINVARLVDGDVGRLVSMQCPRLRELEMTGVSSISAGVIYICNASCSDVSASARVPSFGQLW
jgi:hypothetical protein